MVHAQARKRVQRFQAFSHAIRAAMVLHRFRHRAAPAEKRAAG
jgi:hypothetical protein